MTTRRRRFDPDPAEFAEACMTFTVHELAQRYGVTTRTIRHYHKTRRPGFTQTDGSRSFVALAVQRRTLTDEEFGQMVRAEWPDMWAIYLQRSAELADDAERTRRQEYDRRAESKIAAAQALPPEYYWHIALNTMLRIESGLRELRLSLEREVRPFGVSPARSRKRQVNAPAYDRNGQVWLVEYNLEESELSAALARISFKRGDVYAGMNYSRQALEHLHVAQTVKAGVLANDRERAAERARSDMASSGGNSKPSNIRDQQKAKEAKKWYEDRKRTQPRLKYAPAAEELLRLGILLNIEGEPYGYRTLLDWVSAK